MAAEDTPLDPLILPSLETPTLTKAELAELLFDRLGLNKRESKDMVEAFFEIVHGTLVVGRTVPEAFRWMYNTERACEQQVAAQSGGARLRMPPDAAVATIREQARNRAGAAKLIWPPLLRLLDARYPGFRD